MLEQFSCEALRRIGVSVSGAWQPGETRDWRGQAQSQEAVVAVIFSRRGTGVLWCKSERANPAGQPVRLLLGPYDSLGRDVQVNFSIGGGHVLSRTLVESATYRPPIQPQTTGETGIVLPFASVEGSQHVHLLVLFLAGSDVKAGRNGLWHLRPHLVASVPDAFRAPLVHGRTGELAAP
jgi:hypothetical protein